MSNATGSVEEYTRADGSKYYRARIRLKDGTRERVDIPAKQNTDEKRAIYAEALQERETEKGDLFAKKQARIAAKSAAATPTGPETLRKYRERLNEHREELGAGKGDPSAWNAWIIPHLGGKAIATITREEIETFRDTLDAAITKHTKSAGAEGISPKRGLNIWSEVTTTFKAAVNAKRRDLRVRTDNPCSGVLPPERGDARKKTFIYPAEMLRVLEGDAPIEWREVYAIGSYLYLRPGELRALTWGDVDLNAMLVHITKAYDERTSKVKPPKTRNGVREVPIPAALAPLLRRMRKSRDDRDLVVPILGTLSDNRRAINIRTDLRRAGCARPRLYEDSATTMAVNFRSLRDSGITWLAIAGVDVVKIQRRAGHDDVGTTMEYVKQAEDLGGTLGEPFGALPTALVDGVEPVGGSGGSRQRRAKQRAKLAKALADGLESPSNFGSARGTGARPRLQNGWARPSRDGRWVRFPCASADRSGFEGK